MKKSLQSPIITRFRELVNDLPHHTIHELNQLAEEAKDQLYSLLIPDSIFDDFGIDRRTLTNRHGEHVVKIIASERTLFTIIEVREHPDDLDCIFLLEIEDTAFYKIDINFLIINDPHGPRFNTDLDEAGRRTKFATVKRNIPEEIKAMQAGLAPGQVRQGLRLFKDFVPIATDFIASMDQDMVIAEPLAYNNAIIFESQGFGYIRGRRKMVEINEGFQPGGELLERLDGCNPFRQPGAEKTVRGRSWAIHDGILDEPWRGIEMYRPTKPANVCTFPGWVY